MKKNSKTNKLPVELKDELCRGWYLICQNKEIILIGNKNKRRLWNCPFQKFIFDWEVDIELIKHQEEILYSKI